MINLNVLSAGPRSPRHCIPTWRKVFDHVGASLDSLVGETTWGRENKVFTGGEYLRVWISLMLNRPEIELPILYLKSEQPWTGKTTFLNAVFDLFEPTRFNGQSDFLQVLDEGMHFRVLQLDGASRHAIRVLSTDETSRYALRASDCEPTDYATYLSPTEVKDVEPLGKLQVQLAAERPEFLHWLLSRDVLPCQEFPVFDCRRVQKSL